MGNRGGSLAAELEEDPIVGRTPRGENDLIFLEFDDRKGSFEEEEK